MLFSDYVRRRHLRKLLLHSRTRRASDNRVRSSSRSITHQFALPNDVALLVLNMLSR